VIADLQAGKIFVRRIVKVLLDKEWLLDLEPVWVQVHLDLTRSSETNWITHLSEYSLFQTTYPKPLLNLLHRVGFQIDSLWTGAVSVANSRVKFVLRRRPVIAFEVVRGLSATEASEWYEYTKTVGEAKVLGIVKNL
jgi:hypothetical protein